MRVTYTVNACYYTVNACYLPKLQCEVIINTEILAVVDIVGDVVIKGFRVVKMLRCDGEVEFWDSYQRWEISNQTCEQREIITLKCLEISNKTCEQREIITPKCLEKRLKKARHR